MKSNDLQFVIQQLTQPKTEQSCDLNIFGRVSLNQGYAYYNKYSALLMKQVLLISLVILIFRQATAQQFKRITSYSEYLRLWKDQVAPQLIHNVTHLALPSQVCDGRQCQFYYYQYVDSKLQSTQATNKTLLLVSGMHGNQYLGPHTLLYAYKRLSAARIIYFPLANPSGFERKIRKTYPSNLDPNRDYPIDNQTECYKVSSTHILDYIFRKYQIDLTVVIHNGQTSIGFNWGTFKHSKNSHTPEYSIYYSIAQMLRYYAGSKANAELEEFQIGTMDEVIYPANGTFDDWAYAASKYPDVITKCVGYEYKQYPPGMTNGLVFIIEMGPFAANEKYFGNSNGINSLPYSRNSNDGHISRIIRALRQLTFMINPTIQFFMIKNQLIFRNKGCKKAKLTQLKSLNKLDKRQVFSLSKPLIIEGSVNKQIFEQVIELNKTYQVGTEISLSGSFLCDSEWVGLGTTMFAKERIYNFQNQITVADKKYQAIDNELFLGSNIQMMVIFIIFLALGLIVLIVKVIKRSLAQSKKEKFNTVQTIVVNTENEVEQDPDQEYEMSADLHTARGGIIEM